MGKLKFKKLQNLEFRNYSKGKKIGKAYKNSIKWNRESFQRKNVYILPTPFSFNWIFLIVHSKTLYFQFELKLFKFGSWKEKKKTLERNKDNERKWKYWHSNGEPGAKNYKSNHPQPIIVLALMSTHCQTSENLLNSAVEKCRKWERERKDSRKKENCI